MEEKKEIKPEIQQKPEIKYEFKGKVFQDEEQVAFFKHENLIHKLQNKLIGDFDAKGSYVLPKEILKDLLALKKVIQKKDGKFTYLKADCGSHVFYFEMESGEYGKGISFAQILLLEQYSFLEGDVKATLKTPIVFYTDDRDAYFETKIKKIFNIVSEDDLVGKEKENEAIATALLEKIKLMKKHYERYLLETRLRDKIYIEKIMKILSQDLVYGPAILKKYEERIKKYGKLLDATNKNYYRLLKQILDEILLEEEKSVSKEVAMLIGRLRKVYVQANTQTVDVIMVPPKVTKKEEEKIKPMKGPGSTSFKYNSPSKSAEAAKKKYSSAGLLGEDQPKAKTENKVSQIKKEINSSNLERENSFDIFSGFNTHIEKESNTDKTIIPIKKETGYESTDKNNTKITFQSLDQTK